MFIEVEVRGEGSVHAWAWQLKFQCKTAPKLIHSMRPGITAKCGFLQKEFRYLLPPPLRSGGVATRA